MGADFVNSFTAVLKNTQRCVSISMTGWQSAWQCDIMEKMYYLERYKYGCRILKKIMGLLTRNKYT